MRHPIHRISSKDQVPFQQALSLLNQVLGEELYTRESLQRNSDGEDSLLLVHFDGVEVVGVAMAGRLKDSGINFYSPFGTAALELLRANSIGVLRNSAVNSGYQGKGIGTALLAHRLQWLKQIECNSAVGLTWLHGKTIQSDRLYKAAGFLQIGPVVPEFFKSLSDATGMKCPNCGFPCLCSAAMFAKKL